MKRTFVATLAGVTLGALPLAALAATALEPGYALDYDLDVKTASATGSFSSNGVPYTTNNSATIANGSFTRVAYELTLSGSTNANSPNGTVWVSFDTPSASANQLGVPTTGSGEFYQQAAPNMNVVVGATGSGVTNGGVTTQTGLTNGNIQFWPSNYAPNSATNRFDWNNNSADKSQGYGSMDISQITNSTGSTGNMFLSFNNWSSNKTFDAGLGNNTGADRDTTTVDPNYTFRNNIGDYASAELSVWVNTPEPATLGLLSIAALGLLSRRRRV